MLFSLFFDFLRFFQIGLGKVWLFLVGVNCLNLMDSVLNVFLFGLRCFGSFWIYLRLFWILPGCVRVLLLLFVVNVVLFCFGIFCGVSGGTRCFKLFLVDLVSQTCLRLSQ